MITIPDRVYHSIDCLERGQFEFALEQAAIAVDITAQHNYKKTRSSKSTYKSFLKEYYWVMELMALGGVDLHNSTFSNFSIEDNGKIIEKPNLSDLIYHIVRCSLVHGAGLPKNLVFVPERCITLAHEYISLPVQVIWGLLATVVFAKVNFNEKSEGEYFFTYEHEKFLIRDCWGGEDLLRPFFDQHIKLRVALNIPRLPKISGT